MAKYLTTRDKQVLALIGKGLTNREISRSLSISESTIENHIHHLYIKLNITRRSQAIIYTLREKVIEENNNYDKLI